METELNNTKTTSNATHDVDKVEETYKGFYELKNNIQYEISVSSSKNKEVIDSYGEGIFNDDDPSCGTSISQDIQN